MEPLPLSFYLRDALEVAPQLLGKILVRQTKEKTSYARIVETEAYEAPRDKACHAYGNKKTGRTQVMFEQGGRAYIYLIYGMYHCLNVVTREEHTAHAVLIRAIEPLDEASLPLMRQNRPIKSKKIIDLSNGPGKLCMALDLTKQQNGRSLLDKESGLWIGEGDMTGDIMESKRVNIDYAEEYKDVPWRFYLKDNPFVSVVYKEDQPYGQ